MHPAKEGFSALPFFDEFDLSTVDILLISQYVAQSSPSQSSFWRRKNNASFESKMPHWVPRAVAQIGVSGGEPCFSDTVPISLHVYHQKPNTILFRATTTMCAVYCLFVFLRIHIGPFHTAFPTVVSPVSKVTTG